MIKALVFDLDDTLFPESQFALSGFQAVDHWIKRELRVEGFAKAAEERFSTGSRGRIFDEALAVLHLNSSPDLIQKLVSIYRAHKPSIQLFPDADWALTRFASRFSLGLISDGYYDTQNLKLEALQLKSRLQAFLLSDQLGREYWKPNAITYKTLEERLGCNGNECVYIGDNPQKDFIGAKRRHWFTIRIRRPQTEHFHLRLSPEFEADLEIASLLELEAVFPKKVP
jgi:putative hydrolase of the HAD superfamily